MYYLGVALIIMSIFYVYVMLMKPPFIWKTKKVQIFLKMMGEKGFMIFMVVWTALVFTGGYLLVINNPH